MLTMPLNPTWEDIALRLALTLVAGALIGFNREAHGRAAGLRTTILVCLAASVAMILANMMLTMSGKTDSSFVRTDVMRLPLGVLTGVGFIGGGANSSARQHRRRRDYRRDAMASDGHRALLRRR